MWDLIIKREFTCESGVARRESKTMVHDNLYRPLVTYPRYGISAELLCLKG